MQSGNNDRAVVSDDASYQLLAARYIRKQIKQLAGQIDGVRRADDIEYVHRARVATRRLRAGLQMFSDCYDSRTTKRWQKAIRQLTKGLGDARDADVQTDFVVSVLAELENREHYPGIARLLVKVDRRREIAQPEVNEALEQFESSGVLAEIGSETKKTISTLEKREVSIQSPIVFQQAGQHILSRLDGFLEHQDCLADAEQHVRHHAMRIAAKRLRYTMEICKPAYENQLDEFISSAKEVQSLLGEIHDCDVWIKYLAKFLKKERTRIVKFFGHDKPLGHLRAGIDFLEQRRRQQRGEFFMKLHDYWAELERQKLWDNLRATVRERSERPMGQKPSSDVAISEVDCAVPTALGGPHTTSTVPSADLTSAPPRTDT